MGLTYRVDEQGTALPPNSDDTVRWTMEVLRLVAREPLQAAVLATLLRGCVEDPDMAEDVAQYLDELAGAQPQGRRRKAAIPPAMRWSIWARDDFRCHYCGSRYELTLDHVVPESQGGPTTPDNLVTACRDCNTRKSTRRGEAYAADLFDIFQASGV